MPAIDSLTVLSGTASTTNPGSQWERALRSASLVHAHRAYREAEALPRIQVTRPSAAFSEDPLARPCAAPLLSQRVAPENVVALLQLSLTSFWMEPPPQTSGFLESLSKALAPEHRRDLLPSEAIDWEMRYPVPPPLSMRKIRVTLRHAGPAVPPSIDDFSDF